MLYQTDFSSDPGWTTDRPSDYYWDATGQCLHFTVRNEIPSGTHPNRYFYTVLPHAVPSFTITWDEKVTQDMWSANVRFGIYDSQLCAMGAGQYCGQTSTIQTQA